MILKNSGTGWNTIPDSNINDGIKKERSSRMEKILQQTRCENIPHRLIFKVGVPFEGLAVNNSIHKPPALPVRI